MQNIDIKLKPSKLFMILSASLIVMSVITIATLSIDWILKVVLIAITLLYGGWIFWTVVLMKGSNSLLGLLLLKDGSCRLQFTSNTIEAEIMGESIATSEICVLSFNVQDRKSKLVCVVFKDSLEKGMYRKLLVWLGSFCDKSKEKTQAGTQTGTFTIGSEVSAEAAFEDNSNKAPVSK